MKKLITILLLMINLSGCSFSEIEEYAIVTGIGIDYIDNKYEITVEIIKQSSGESFNLESVIISATGKTIDTTFKEFDNFYSEKLFFDHCSLIIVGEECAKKGINELIDYIIHYPSIRSTTYIMIANNTSAKEVYNVKNDFNTIISMDIANNLKENQGMTNIWSEGKVYHIINALLDENSAVVLPIVTIEEDKLNISGGAIVRNYKLQCYADGEEVTIIKLLWNKLKTGIININNINNNNLVPKVEGITVDKKIKEKNVFLYSFSIGCIFYEEPQDYNLNNLEDQKRLESFIKEAMHEKITQVITKYQELELDIMGVFFYIKTKRPKIYEEVKDDFNNYYKNLQFKLDIKILIFSGGYAEGGKQ